MSLRGRLLVGVAMVAVVLAVAAVLITRTTESDLVDRVDAQLVAADPAVHDAGFDPPGPGGPGDHHAGGPTGGNLTTLYVASVYPDGTVDFVETPTVGASDDLPAISGDKALESAQEADPKPFTVGTDPASGARYRVLAVRSRAGSGTIVIALPLHDVDAAVSRLIRVEISVTLLIVAVLGLVTFWVLRLGVRPIKQMTVTATAIAGGDLSHRVPDVKSGTEAGDLGHALNAMLGRIEDAFNQRALSEARLRQFVGDASHELRTPVTTIRGYAELYRAGGLEDADELAQAMRRTEAEAIRMGALVDDLLLLARLDQGRPLEQSRVDLGALATDAATDARVVNPARVIELEAKDPVTVTGDEMRLRQVVANLMANAVLHTAPEAAIAIRTFRDAGRAVLEVEDHGAGMAPDIASHAFERFYRADRSRSRAAGGTGLGLSIVRAIVEAHGGAVSLRSALGAGTTVRVELPAT
jgi:two-component system OmpR family sensor kinase